MANSTLKLRYFDLTGKAEVLRLILTAAGKEFEDIRIDRDTEWPAIKPTTPYGQVPTMEIDGKDHGQTLPLANFLAKEFGFYAKTNMDALIIDQVCQLWDQFIHMEYGRLYREPESTHQEIKRKLKEEDAPRYLGYYEKLLKDSGTGYFAGNSMTLADIVVFDFCTGFLDVYVGEYLDKFPLVKALVEKVGNHEKIKAYMAKRK